MARSSRLVAEPTAAPPQRGPRGAVTRWRETDGARDLVSSTAPLGKYESTSSSGLEPNIFDFGFSLVSISPNLPSKLSRTASYLFKIGFSSAGGVSEGGKSVTELIRVLSIRYFYTRLVVQIERAVWNVEIPHRLE